jgi:hypothetical protein
MCIYFPLNQNSAVLLHVNCGVGEPLMYEQGIPIYNLLIICPGKQNYNHNSNAVYAF